MLEFNKQLLDHGEVAYILTYSYDENDLTQNFQLEERIPFSEISIKNFSTVKLKEYLQVIGRKLSTLVGSIDHNDKTRKSIREGIDGITFNDELKALEEADKIFKKYSNERLRAMS